jgi:spermidine/putrescine transport system ATP-binding protein
VALARALINRPHVLLLDEPLGALDLKLRRQMQLELKRIQTEVGITFVHVTHDQEEAMTMADTIAVMNGGRVEQLGHPAELYEAPRTTFVANFLGQSNLVEAAVTGTDGDQVIVDMHGHRIHVLTTRCQSDTGDVLVGVRPEKLHIAAVGKDGKSAAADAASTNAIEGVVTDSSFTGVSTQYLVRMPWGQELTVFAQNSGGGAPIAAAENVVLSWQPDHTFALDAAQDAAAGQVIEDSVMSGAGS